MAFRFRRLLPRRIFTPPAAVRQSIKQAAAPLKKIQPGKIVGGAIKVVSPRIGGAIVGIADKLSGPLKNIFKSPRDKLVAQAAAVEASTFPEPVPAASQLAAGRSMDFIERFFSWLSRLFAPRP